MKNKHIDGIFVCFWHRSKQVKQKLHSKRKENFPELKMRTRQQKMLIAIVN